LILRRWRLLRLRVDLKGAAKPDCGGERRDGDFASAEIPAKSRLDDQLRHSLEP